MAKMKNGGKMTPRFARSVARKHHGISKRQQAASQRRREMTAAYQHHRVKAVGLIWRKHQCLSA